MCVNMCLNGSRRRSGPRSPSTNKLMIPKLNENRKGGLSIRLQPFLPAGSIIQCIHKRSICFRLFLSIKSLHPLVHQIFVFGFVFLKSTEVFCHVQVFTSSLSPLPVFICTSHVTTRISSRQTVFQSSPIVVSGLQFITQLHKHSYRAAQQRRSVFLHCVGKQAGKVTF